MIVLRLDFDPICYFGRSESRDSTTLICLPGMRQPLLLSHLPPVAARIIEKIEWLAEHPELLKHPLKNMPRDLKGLQKYKVGDHRVLFWVDHNHKAITLYGVEHRRTVY